MAVNVKLGVDLSGFNSGIREGQGILKGLNAEMKATEAEFKATGNAEQMLTNKTKVLSQQIRVQKGIATEAEKALKAMTDAGVDPANAAYQKLYATMMNATAGMNTAQAELNALGESANDAAAGANNLTSSVNNIGKKISLDQVISGIDKITNGLENAAKKAVQLGQDIWNSVMDSAKWADDTATQAAMFGIDVETFQRMQKLVQNGMDTTVESMLKSQQKFNKNIGEGKKEFTETMKELGLVVTEYGGKTAEGIDRLITDDSLDLFFRAGQAIMNLGDEFEKEAYAQRLFGKSWRELVPLFTDYKSADEYNAALNNVKITSEEDVTALAELNDKVGELKGNFDTLSRDVMAQLAPTLTEAATALNGLLQNVLEYLETPEGKEMLQGLSESVSKLFDGMKDINAEDVVSGFKDAFDKVMDVLNWIVNNRDTVVAALEGIFGFWATLKVSDGVLTILKVINGLKDLAGLGGAGALGSGLGTALTQGATSVAGLAGNEILMGNIPVFGDWLTHEGPLGALLNGTQTWDDVGRDFENWQREVFGDNGLIANFWNDLTHLGDENYDFDSHQELTLEPKVEIPPEEKEDIQKQIDAMTPEMKLKVILDFQFGGGPAVESDGTGWAPKANGISFVPYDGYLARLHKGERVVPAREVQSRSYNSNLYVESMYMNNGTDAAGLASAMAAAQQRTMSGYGS